MSEQKNRNRNNPARIIYLTMMWSRALVPAIALFAAIASAVRTFQTTAEIYSAGGTSSAVTIGVSVALTIAVEGAIFGLAMARQWQEIRWRQAHKKRYVVSVRSITRSVKVRLGIEEPLSYDQMPENANVITLVMMIAFGYALVSNFNMGVRPLIAQIGGEASIQDFFATLMNAPASIQITFIVDSASILFPPFMALAAGHLTARWASEIVSSMNRAPGVRAEAKSAAAEQPSPAFKKTPRERVAEHLSEHPEDEALSQHKLAKKLGVSVGTVNKVINEIRASGRQIEHSENGHGGPRV